MSGEDAVNIIQQNTSVAPVVEVRDRNDLPIAGVPVTFTIGGGNTAAFAGGAKTITVTTNAAGRAAVSGLTPLSNGTVQVNVSAAFQGQTATATITQTNFATAAQASQAGNASTQGAAQAGGFPLKTVIFLGAAGAGTYVGYDLYQKYGSGSACAGSLGGSGTTGPIPAAGGTFNVSVEESCPFRLTTNVPWISFSVSSTQVFEQALSFTYTVAANTGPARSGMISVELADGTGGMGFGVNQAAGSLTSFRGTVPSVAGGADMGDALCSRTVSLSEVTALLTGVETGISHAEVSVLETLTPGTGCPRSAHPSSRRTYLLQSGSVIGQTVVLRLASTPDAALPTLSLSGRLSQDNSTMTGLLTWHGIGDALTGVTSPITLSVVVR